MSALNFIKENYPNPHATIFAVTLMVLENLDIHFNPDILAKTLFPFDEPDELKSANIGEPDKFIDFVITNRISPKKFLDEVIDHYVVETKQELENQLTTTILKAKYGLFIARLLSADNPMTALPVIDTIISALSDEERHELMRSVGDGNLFTEEEEIMFTKMALLILKDHDKKGKLLKSINPN